MRYSTCFISLGWLLIACAVAVIIPVLAGLIFGEGQAVRAFLAGGVISAFAGGASLFALRGAVMRARRHELLLTIVMAWAVVPFFAAMPFLLSGATETFSNAYFEAVSGLTTTGATIFSSIDALPRSIVLWRALLQWIGGFSGLAIVIAVYPVLNIGGMQLFNNQLPHGEGESLLDRVRGVLLATWQVYLLLTFICMILLWVTGIPFFDAICLAFSTLSTGGFMPRDGTLSVYSSRLTEIVLIPFMALAALNFTLHRAFLDGRSKVYGADPETRRFLMFVMVATVLLAVGIKIGLGAGGDDYSLIEALRNGFFTAVSMVSTTGFITGDASAFPLTVVLLIMPLILIGGATGSTAGGLKMMRTWILTLHGDREFWLLAHPHGVVNKSFGGNPVSSEVIASVWALFVLFIISLCAITLALTAAGLDLQSATSAAAASLSNTGPALALMSPDLPGYWAISEFGRWVICFSMILGRLEVLPLLVLLTTAFWRS